jgi:hypothetical protein
MLDIVVVMLSILWDTVVLLQLHIIRAVQLAAWACCVRYAERARASLKYNTL